MRLPRTHGDKSGSDPDEAAISPEIKRDLEAIDRALAGADATELGPELGDLATLTAEIREQRPEPDPDWQLEMDVRAGAGFGSSPARRLQRLLGGRRPAQVLLPAGALATVAVVVGIGVVGSLDDPSNNGSGDAGSPTSVGALAEDAGAGGGRDAGELNGDFRQFDREADGQFVAPSAVAAPSGGEAADAAVDPSVAAKWKADGTRSGQRLQLAQRGLLRAYGAAGYAPREIAPGGGSNRNARGQNKRIQDRNASLILETGTKKVREVSDQAIQITESVGGVVVSANLTEGEKRAGAVLDLQIPTRDLDATLDRLTDLANVKSLNEGSVDITKPFVSAQDRLKDARAERTMLLKALGNATTEAEAEALREQLKDARKQISRARSQFENIARQGRLSNVFVEIQGRSGLDSSDDSWTLGDAANDALDALKTVAGVMLIAAAILAPLAILGAVVAALAITVRRKRREAALDE